MSLQAVYERFLKSPNSSSLTDNASLNYITTLTTFTNAEQVVKHLETQNKSVVKKKAEKVIGAVEGQSSLALDVETTLEFISGGGTYLPGLENFVTDKILTFPAIHTVHFDQDIKIRHIRICWDQGALLKQVGVIGSRGNNWPICDGKDQARLIASGPTAVTSTKPAVAPAPAMTRGRDMDEVPVTTRSESPNKKHIKDPYTSLDLFGPEKENANNRISQPGAIAPRQSATQAAPRQSARPPQREMSELFAAGHEDYEPGRPKSPLKKENQASVVAPKGGAGKHYQESRLFSEEPSTEAPPLYKSNPAKYNHFDLGDAPEKDHFQHAKSPLSENAIPMRARTNKHASQWGFEDFVTPEKANRKARGQEVRNFGWSDDEAETAETPGKHRKPAQTRKDMDEVHFELQDDGLPSGKKRPAGTSKGSVSNNVSRLYQNNLYEDGMHTGVAEKESRPLKGTTTHVGMYENNLYEDGMHTSHEDQKGEPLKNVTNNVGRGKDFAPHWAMQDVSPANGKPNKENKPMGNDQKQAVNMMAAQWDTYDESPEQHKKSDLKGLRKGQESHWGNFENENTKPSTGATKQEKSFWDF